VDCVEINSMFYRPPVERNSKSWLTRTSGRSDFFFAAKLHHEFTHKGKIDPATVKQFHTGFETLLEEGKFRHLLIQFKYDFSDTAQSRQG
jgi:uncharacterized protein YecE (DUF72 family)